MLRTAALLPFLTVAMFAQEKVADLWIQDFAKAKAQAKAEKKDLLIDFTGSDWCGWCIKLDKEVFSQAAFQASAPKSFILVKLDYPQNESLVTEDIRKQNAGLQTEYSIQGYPTILLTDAEGRVYAQTGYQEGGPEKYNDHLAELHKKGDAFKTAIAAAEGKQGAERAKALAAVLATLEDEVAETHHFKFMKEIVELDADGKAGLKAKYEDKVKEIGQRRELNEVANELNQLVSEHMQKGEGEQALAKLDEILKAPKSKLRQQMAMFFKGMVTMDVKGDAKAAVALLEEAQKLIPDSPIAGRIDEILPDLKKQVEDGKEGKKEEGK